MKKILRAVFLVILCLYALTSCKNEAGETIVIESETTETTAKETEELTTPEITTEEITEITNEETTETITDEDETEEAAPEETTLTIPDEETILASLSDEEKEVWLSMPDIVTMRVLSRYNEKEEKLYTEFLYSEIIYIDKIGQVKKFISYDELKTNNDDEYIEWLNDQISQNEEAEIINVANIHTLIEFYNTFMCIDSDHKWASNYTVGLAEYIERHYGFSVFGTRNNIENGLETLSISRGNAGNYRVPRNYTDEGEQRDRSGRKTFDLYLRLDPFMVDGGGGTGHLIGEEG